MKHFIKLLAVALLLVTLVSCITDNKESKISTSNINNAIDTTFICDLEENIDVIQNIDDAVFLNDSTFFVISNKQVIKYNTHGKQLQIFNNNGSGPHEYINPSLLQANDNSLFVWCSMSLKLIEYDSNGNAKSMVTNYKRAIKNFAVYQDKQIFFYKNNASVPGVIDVYDIEKDRVIETIGNAFSEEDLVLLILNSKPGIVIHKEFVYYVKPSSLELFRFDIESFTLETVSNIDDKEFSLSKVDNAANLINTQFMKVIDYINTNSITNNLFLVDGGLIIKSEVGEIVMNEKEQTVDRDKRFNKFYLHTFTDAENQSKVWKTNINPNHYNYINYNSQIYIIENTMDSESEKSRLYKIQM